MRDRRVNSLSAPSTAKALPTTAYHGAMRFEVLGSMRVVAVASAAQGSGVESVSASLMVAEPSLGGPKQRFVLALLLAEPNRIVSVDRIVDGLWGDEPPDTARHTVQGYVSELRKCGRVTDRHAWRGYRVRVDRDTLDSLDFEASVAEARSIARPDPFGAADALESALGLWRGAAFGEFQEAALQDEAARLEELRLAAAGALMQARLDAGQHVDVVAALDRLCREQPYREEFRALHMLALYRSGRQADALRAYRTTRTVLDNDLGIVPSPRLRELEGQILLQDPGLDLAPSRSDQSVLDHRVENPYLGLRAFPRGRPRSFLRSGPTGRPARRSHRRQRAVHGRGRAEWLGQVERRPGGRRAAAPRRPPRGAHRADAARSASVRSVGCCAAGVARDRPVAPGWCAGRRWK